jgi:hypothetical protein
MSFFLCVCDLIPSHEDTSHTGLGFNLITTFNLMTFFLKHSLSMYSGSSISIDSLPQIKTIQKLLYRYEIGADLFPSSLFPKQYSIGTVHIAFTFY